MADLTEGWQIVPIKPTEAMQRRADEYRATNRWAWTFEGAYRAMLKAAPVYSKGQGG